MEKNHLKISSPSITTSAGEVLLNGKPLRDIISLKVDIPEGENKPFVKVIAEFYSAFELDAYLAGIKQEGRVVEFRT